LSETYCYAVKHNSKMMVSQRVKNCAEVFCNTALFMMA